MKTTKDLLNIARHMELTIMQAGEQGQEQQATEDFGRSNSNSKDFVKPMTTEDEQIPGKIIR